MFKQPFITNHNSFALECLLVNFVCDGFAVGIDHLLDALSARLHGFFVGIQAPHFRQPVQPDEFYQPII